MAANLKKDLKAISKELKALTKKIEGMVIAVDKPKKPAASKKKVQAKPIKKTAKKTAAKKTAGLSSIDTVMQIINRNKKGIDVAGIKQRTGYKDRKVYDIVKTLKKRGKIKAEQRGIYLKA